MQGNKPEPPPFLTSTDPDELTVYLTLTGWEKKEKNPKKSQSMFGKFVASPTAKSKIQLLEHATTTKDNLPNDGGLKKDLELQPNMNGTLEERNVEEVYEEPFIRVYVEPLCRGSNC
ncbi:unnamed protein product [Litomosoides sigmodontis]|uniref:Uncharacterized protein n=1 Tax=Litomosoides sigmodontis TaxID=42156 RepID=A0A3P6SRU4_LITSI|nr:unnamed protein product [Litomosoides sigmodontis]